MIVRRTLPLLAILVAAACTEQRELCDAPDARDTYGAAQYVGYEAMRARFLRIAELDIDGLLADQYDYLLGYRSDDALDEQYVNGDPDATNLMAWEFIMQRAASRVSFRYCYTHEDPELCDIPWWYRPEKVTRQRVTEVWQRFTDSPAPAAEIDALVELPLGYDLPPLESLLRAIFMNPYFLLQ